MYDHTNDTVAQVADFLEESGLSLDFDENRNIFSGLIKASGKLNPVRLEIFVAAHSSDSDLVMISTKAPVACNPNDFEEFNSIVELVARLNFMLVCWVAHLNVNPDTGELLLSSMFTTEGGSVSANADFCLTSQLYLWSCVADAICAVVFGGKSAGEAIKIFEEITRSEDRKAKALHKEEEEDEDEYNLFGTHDDDEEEEEEDEDSDKLIDQDDENEDVNNAFDDVDEFLDRAEKKEGDASSNASEIAKNSDNKAQDDVEFFIWGTDDDNDEKGKKA